MQPPLSNILTSWAPSCWDETNRAGSAFQTISGGTGCSSVVQHLPRRHGPGSHPKCGQTQRNKNKPRAYLAFALSCLSPWYPLATPSWSPFPNLCPLDSWGALFLLLDLVQTLCGTPRDLANDHIDFRDLSPSPVPFLTLVQAVLPPPTPRPCRLLPQASELALPSLVRNFPSLAEPPGASFTSFQALLQCQLPMRPSSKLHPHPHPTTPLFTPAQSALVLLMSLMFSLLP